MTDSSQEKAQGSRSYPQGDLESPLLEEELFVGETEAGLELRLAALEAENPFGRAFEQGRMNLLEPDELEEEFDEEEQRPEADESLVDAVDTQDEEAITDLDVGFEELYDEENAPFAVEEEPFPEAIMSPEEEPLIPREAWIEPEEEEDTYPQEEATHTEQAALDEESFVEPEEEEVDWETFESEESPAIPGGVAEFTVTLGKEWTKRRNGSPPAEKITEWLLQDYQDTLEGARHRFKKHPGDDSIGRAWMISRQEQMNFQTSSAGVGALQEFQPPADSVALVSNESLIQQSDKAPVAPLVVRFVQELRQRYRGALDVSTYRGHGGGKFQDRGYSIDLFLQGRDDRGFYPSEEAGNFLRALHEAARAANADWRVIYNDFSVADTINRETGQKHVIFVGTVRRSKSKKITGLNWHGPHPLILHFHLDLVPRASASTARGSIPSSIIATSTSKPSPGAAKPQAELVRFAQRVLNATEGEQLTVDGIPGPRTGGALERFRSKYNLGAGGWLDYITQLALAQRALEELAQRSMFEIGKRDVATDRALSEFKTQRGLGAEPALDAATRAALSDALERRVASPDTSPAKPVTNWAQVDPSQRMRYVMGLLVRNYQYPENGAAGIVGNLWAESAVLPNSIEGSTPSAPMRAPDFTGKMTEFTAEQVMNRNIAAKQGPRRPGIGLAQWSSAPRRAGLFNHTFQGRKLGANILYNMDAQVDYLVTELQTRYRHVNNILRKGDVSLEEASDEVIYNYEVPGSILGQPDPEGRRRKLPRSHQAVKNKFEERRSFSRNALRAYQQPIPS